MPSQILKKASRPAEPEERHIQMKIEALLMARAAASLKSGLDYKIFSMKSRKFAPSFSSLP